MIRRLLLGLVVLTSAVHCNRENALETPVMYHCSEFAAEIEQTAQNYEGRSKIVDETLSPEQLRAADARLGIIPFDERYVTIVPLGREFTFCEHVRKVDEQTLRSLEDRTRTAFAAYAKSVQLSDAAKALRDLSAIAAETSHLPLK